MLDKAKIVVLATADLLRQDEGVGVHFNDVITLALPSESEQGKKPHHCQHAEERGYINSRAPSTRGYNGGRFTSWLHFGYRLIFNFIDH